MRQVAKDWSAEQIGDLAGKHVIVTGANSGIGFYTALELGRHGAHVTVACRDPQRGAEALDKLKTAAPSASFTLETLDLAELASVRAFADRYNARNVPLDILVNNAGVMALPKRETTADGFERQLGTNHLGHFALTGLLLPSLHRASAPRVVSVSSAMAYIGKIDTTNLQAERKYSTWRVYSASKLANLLFMEELGRRAPWLTSVAAHPGFTRTNLQRHTGAGTAIAAKLFSQDAPAGALPSLYAATGEVATGEFFGPSKLFNMNGSPVEVKSPKRAHDVDVARSLWQVSEQLTGVPYALGDTAR